MSELPEVSHFFVRIKLLIRKLVESESLEYDCKYYHFNWVDYVWGRVPSCDRYPKLAMGTISWAGTRICNWIRRCCFLVSNEAELFEITDDYINISSQSQKRFTE